MALGSSGIQFANSPNDGSGVVGGSDNLTYSDWLSGLVAGNNPTPTSSLHSSTLRASTSPSLAPNDGYATITTSSNGQIYTTTVAQTITQMVTSPPTATPTSSNSKINMVAIVGTVGGVGVLIVISLLVFLCMRRRKKDIFDGNFDPANVGSVKGGGGGTLPDIDLEEDGLLVNNEVESDEDDGMGGRLRSGPGGGGIIVPYSFQPTPVGGTAVGQQYQNHPQMQQIVAADDEGAALAAGYTNSKRAMRHQYAQRHTPTNQTIHPSSNPNQHHLNPFIVPLEQYSPEPFVFSSSSGGGNANEIEAVGGVISNRQLPAFQQQSYLQSGPRQQQQDLSSSSPTLVSSQPPTYRAGTAVVVHEDGDRDVLSKDEEAEEDREVLSTEVPPTYDSLLRRE